MLRIIFLSTCLSFAIAEFLYAGTGCTISIDYKTGDLKDPQPLILTPSAKNRDFFYPKDNKPILKLRKGQSVYLACTGKDNYLKDAGKRQEAKAVCVKDKIFSIDGVPRPFSNITCDFMPKHEARRMKTPCLGQHLSVAIGFQTNNTFLQVIEVCRDDELFETFYTKFRLIKTIGGFQSSYPRPNWISGNFYPGIRIHDLYKVESQIETIGKILNSTEIAKDSVKQGSQFLSRGHLTAKADFVYGSQQRSTFWLLNAAPQWQTFNAGNWLSLENGVRNLAISRYLDLDVYTGVHGQMTMKDARGKQQPIHLHYDGENRIVATPKFFWKIIYDPSSRNGTAFVGLNDPFIKSVTKKLYLCKDISSKLKWLNWDPKNVTLGISYACTVDSLRKVVPAIPPLEVDNVLI